MNESGKNPRQQDDERLDTMVRDLAADYNLPPHELDADRREALFERIQLQRRLARHHSPARRKHRRRLGMQWLAAAAVLVVGFSIGRWMPANEGNEAIVAADGSVATDVTNPRANLYQLAARDYLERTESLLVQLRRAAYSPDAPSPLGLDSADPTVRWAHELLRESRLLQDSPAVQDDAQLAALLEDLELLLARIVQTARQSDDLDANDVDLADPAVLQRLRNEIEGRPDRNEI